VINLLPGPLRFETFNFDKSIVKKGGCFPYTNDYKYTHSAVGMGIIGSSFDVNRKLVTDDGVERFVQVSPLRSSIPLPLEESLASWTK
jgi:hypothetical protein